VKTADITDEALLDAIRTVHRVRWGEGPAWTGASKWDIAAVLDGHPEWCGKPEATDGSVSIPVKVVRAKAAKLVRRGLLDGCCDCDCRGDFMIRAAPPTWGDPHVTYHGQRPWIAVSNTESRWAGGLKQSPFV
jgi:hypothetical protein